MRRPVLLVALATAAAALVKRTRAQRATRELWNEAISPAAPPDLR